MTFPFSLIFFCRKAGGSASFAQRLFIDNKAHNIPQFRNILEALFHQFQVFVKGTCKLIDEHILQPQHFVQILKGMMPNSRFFPAQHGIPFLKGGKSLLVGFFVDSAEGALVPVCSPGGVRRRKGKYGPSHREFRRNVQMDVKPAVGGNINGLLQGNHTNQYTITRHMYKGMS